MNPTSISTKCIDSIRVEANSHLDPERKATLGQFMTPSVIAEFMAHLFKRHPKQLRLLDAGAGVGSLTSAFLDTFLQKAPKNATVQVEAWEIDATLRTYLHNTLAIYKRKAQLAGVTFSSELRLGDFIQDTARNLTAGDGVRFTHAILNPPYKKINSNSEHRLLLRKVGIETVNLYTAFLALSILLMEKQGEIVAIIPRSFCNGTYYKPFREFLLSHCAMTHIHLFESRKKAFKDDDVLQENIIIHLVKGGTQADVVISASHDSKFEDYNEQRVPFTEVVKRDDPNHFIHIPTLESPHRDSPLFMNPLASNGLAVSTGPVVDFRMRDYTRQEPKAGDAPLLYCHHFVKGKFTWPKKHKKPNAILVNSATKNWLMPSGFYVLVKRFSTKEERRRVVAYVVSPKELDGVYFGFENHWNVYHEQKHGLDEYTAYGLALFLNSTLVDEHFRVFSGHTQVNATDLKLMKYPPREVLRDLGKHYRGKILSQDKIDEVIRAAEERTLVVPVPLKIGKRSLMNAHG